MSEIFNWRKSADSLSRDLQNWWQSVDPAMLLLALILAAVVILLRNQISGWIVAGIRAMFRTVSVDLDQEVSEQLKETSVVLLCTLMVAILLSVLALTGAIGEFVSRLIISVAVIAVFSAWYHLAANFLAVLHSRKFRKISVESGWMVRVTQFAILLFGITALLDVWSVDISGALTGVGVLGAGLAIALQDLIRNLVAGMSNISENRFETGDVIEVDGVVTGTVQQVDLRSTQVVGFDQIPRYIPNSELSNSAVMNLSRRKHRQIYQRVKLVLSSSEEQIRSVRDALQSYLENSGDFVNDGESPCYVRVFALSESSVDLLIYALTQENAYAAYLDVVDRLTLKIMSTVEEAGTSLAYPTQSIVLESSTDDPAKPSGTTS